MKEGLPLVDRHKVVVLSITYNHSQYIEETLMGFAMQQTDFPFLCCVFDDASTDGEQEILKRWIDEHCHYDDVEVYDHPLAIILKAADKDNPNCIYCINLHKANLWGKPERTHIIRHWQQTGEYIAMCEGDDYWTDPLKLQKQVDFLDSHPDYVMCSHHFDLYHESTQTLESDWFKHIEIDYEYNLDSFITREAWMTQPLTVLYRYGSLNQSEYQRYKYAKDVTLFYHLLRQGKGMLLKDNMGRYRIHNGGIWSKIDKGKQTKAEMLTAMGVYNVHKDRSSAILLANSAYRFPGIRFFRENGELYRTVLKIIYKELGFRWWWKFLKKTCNPNKK